MRVGLTAALIQGRFIRGMTWFSFPERNRCQYRWRQFKLPLAIVGFLLVCGISLYLSGFYMAEVALPPLLVFFVLLLAIRVRLIHEIFLERASETERLLARQIYPT